MNKMTAKEIIDFCKSKDIPVAAILYGSEYFDYIDEYGDWADDTGEWKEEISSVLGKMESENSYGEGEHWDGASVECVVHFVDHDVYLRSKDLYYQSYEGLCFDEMDWDGVKEVRPTEKTVIVYE